MHITSFVDSIKKHGWFTSIFSIVLLLLLKMSLLLATHPLLALISAHDKPLKGRKSEARTGLHSEPSVAFHPDDRCDHKPRPPTHLCHSQFKGFSICYFVSQSLQGGWHITLRLAAG